MIVVRLVQHMWRFMLLLLMVGMSSMAAAASFDVRNSLCMAVTSEELSASAVSDLRFDCDRAAESYQDKWLWLRVDDPAALSGMSGDWHVLVDQSRFEQIKTVVVTADGRVRSVGASSGNMNGKWLIGGHLRFDFFTESPPVTDVFIGIKRLDNLQTMRKVRLLTWDALVVQSRNWYLLMGLYGGAIGASILFVISLKSGANLRLRQFYTGWAVTVLFYGLFWSNLIFTWLPGLAGSWGVRINMILASASLAMGLAVFIAYIERKALPALYRRLVRWTALTIVVVGVVGSFDLFGFASVIDQILTVIALVSVVTVGTGLGIALMRGSRHALFYALAWGLPLIVIFIRLLRGVGGAEQSDFYDHATLFAIAGQAVILAIGIGDRFRILQLEDDRVLLDRDRDVVQQNLATVERETMRRAAETDQLTGLYNRRGFVQQAQAMIGQHGNLAIIDLDEFQSINDGFGHDVGDAVLVRVAKALAGVAGDQGLAARVGGQEFALIGPLEAAEAARVAVEQLDVGDLLGRGRQVTVSAGVATGVANYEELFVAADRALARAKDDGRNRVVVAGTETTRSHSSR